MQYNPEEYKEILNIFKAESEEIIQSLNDGFLTLERNPNDKTPLKKLFQNAHSIKGAARMLGFNGIQDIAHKLEDILSFWKQDGVTIDSDSFEIIYDVCDFLLESVEKSVENQADYFDVSIVKFLNSLDGFLQNKNKNLKENHETADKKNFGSQITDINAAILELMFVLNKNSNTDNYDEVILVISENLNILAEIFKNSGFDNIKKSIEEIINKLTSNAGNKEILELLKEEIISLKDLIYKELNVSIPSVKFVKENKEPRENQDKQIDKNDEKLDYVLRNLARIKQNKSFIAEISPQILFIEQNTSDKTAKNILSEIISILELYASSEKPVDNDCYMTLLQGIYFVRKQEINDAQEKSDYCGSLLQRLSVVKDMLSTETKKIETPVRQNNDNGISSPFNPDLEIIKKNLNMYELQEIKTLRVDTSKIDNLISQTGELLINGIKTREHLTELSGINNKLIQWNSEGKKIINYLKYLEKKGFFNSEFDESSAAFYKKIQNFLSGNTDIITDLQDDFGRLYNIISEDDNKLHQTVMEIENIAKGIRILPLATIFHSFPRMMRDIANEHNKKIDFIVNGSDTTVDKKLIEEIKMPLIHILRNAVSHGIEKPEERLKNGKNETGTVRLSARQEDNNVLIVIEDDGYGINLEKVKKIAVAKGILLEDELETLSNEQLMKLLFLPGFSTQESINEISGRGIGLDIVKTKINNLNGDIQIDSVLNKGCRVTIKLPLSMSTLKTFIILINNQKYAIPVSAIKFVKKIRKEEIFSRNGLNYIIYEEHSVPIYSISEVFGEKLILNRDEELTVLIIENQDRQAAFIIDKLLGDQEVFHKKLVAPIVRIRNISGFTTLSTGEMCLIINPYELIRNTVMDTSMSSFCLEQIEQKYKEEKHKNKKILFHNCGNIDYIVNDVTREFDNIVSFDNLYSVYDYIQNNDVDVFICKLDNGNNDLLKLLQYIKNDENFSQIKIVIISDLTSLEILTMVNHFKPDLYVKTTDYEKQTFVEALKNEL